MPAERYVRTRSLGVLVEFFVKQDDSKSRGSMLKLQQARCEARLSALHAEATAAEAELADAMVCGLTSAAVSPLLRNTRVVSPQPCAFGRLSEPTAYVSARAGASSYC